MRGAHYGLRSLPRHICSPVQFAVAKGFTPLIPRMTKLEHIHAVLGQSHGRATVKSNPMFHTIGS